MKGNKKDSEKRKSATVLFRVRRKLRTSRVALPFLTSRSPSLRLFRCRSAYWDAIVASPENTRCTWKRVKRSSPLNGEQKKKSPFSFPRCKPMHSCTLFAECFESIPKRVGFDKQVLSRTKIRGFSNWKIRRIGSDSFYFPGKIQVTEFKCSYREKIGISSGKKSRKKCLPCNAI